MILSSRIRIKIRKQQIKRDGNLDYALNAVDCASKQKFLNAKNNAIQRYADSALEEVNQESHESLRILAINNFAYLKTMANTDEKLRRLTAQIRKFEEVQAEME